MTIQNYWFFGSEPEPEPKPEPKSKPKPKPEPVHDHARASPHVRRPKQTLKLFREEPGMTRASDYDHNNQREDHPTPQFLALTLYLEASNDAGHKSKRKCGGRGGASKRVGVIDGPSPAPGIPEALRRRIESELGGDNARLILQKRLYRSDTDPKENRLSMPAQQLAPGDFLSGEEEAECCRRASGDCGRIAGVQAGLIVEPRGGGGGVRIATVGLKKWEYKSSSSYVLCGNWKDIVAENGLEVGDVIQVWFFRDVHGKPCFALVNLGK